MKVLKATLASILLVSGAFVEARHPLHRDTLEQVSTEIETLQRLQDDVDKVYAEAAPDLVHMFGRQLQDVAEAVAEAEEEEGTSCGFGTTCGEGEECVRIGISRHCIPSKCLQEVATKWQESTFTDEFFNSLFEKAGVTQEQVSLVITETDASKRNPYDLMSYDNAFKKFTDVFNANAPESYGEFSQEAMACYTGSSKEASKQGIVPMIGVMWGFGGLVKFEFAWLWGNGSADLDITSGSSFLPSGFFSLTVSGFLGVAGEIAAEFQFFYSGTKNDVPGSSLAYGVRGGLGPYLALKGKCKFPQSVSAFIVDVGVGAGAGLNLGYDHTWMTYNSTATK